MKYLSKFLLAIKHDSKLLQNKEINYILGLTTTQIKDLKKYALFENLINENKREFFVTLIGDKYIQDNPIVSWADEANHKRPVVNLEYLKEEKSPPTLTKAIRNLAKHYLEGEELKENSIEHYLIKDLLCTGANYSEIKSEIEKFILQDKKLDLSCLFAKYTTPPYGLTESIIAVFLLDILVKNKNILAIYERGEFQLKINHQTFDRMIYRPENFEIQKTIAKDNHMLKEFSGAIMPCRSSNVLDVAKYLIRFVQKLEKYALNTERLSKPALKLRNTIRYAKDPISLVYRDIPRALENKILDECDNTFIEKLQEAMQELRLCYSNLIKEIRDCLFNSFDETLRENLAGRFDAVKEYIASDELKILHNNISQLNSNDNNWIERIATFINVSRVPKDWSDNDIADFKLKIKKLSQDFLAIEATTGSERELEGLIAKAFNNVINLLPTEWEKRHMIRKLINE